MIGKLEEDDATLAKKIIKPLRIVKTEEKWRSETKCRECSVETHTAQSNTAIFLRAVKRMRITNKNSAKLIE